ncbi:MotA/TolQ/ExbB proton channel family protein [uncultured Megasphaera sp.]|uniref:MotA/TolQ/ExbB proton channel family protein n=1 Tax=uncultured Megasphaera sp. TaxID=165188 RepID=UPI002631C23F|nr:MotA/TolQ/ExbB proton channel family protein [uncultured Megasphaera sp.]
MDSIIQGFQLFQKGGAVMYLLLACSLFVVYIGAERSIFYQHMDAGKDFANQFYTQMKLHRYDQARQLAAGAEGGLSTIINEIFQGEGGTDVRAYMEMQSGIFVSKLRSRLYYLSVIVTLAPILGLLGTISGMIRAFSVLNVQSGQAVAITGGVGEALIATAFGLCVAVLALVVHSYFTQRLDRIITDMEMCFSALETMPVKAGQ